MDLRTAGLSDDAAAEAIRTVTLDVPELFMSRYFTDDKGEALRMKQFQVDYMEAFLDPAITKLLVMMPAGHSKTTTTRFLCAYVIARNPNVRIMSIMNNATDAEMNLGALERALEDPDSLLTQEHGPFKSARNWKATQFSVAKRTIDDKDPTFAAYGTGSNVFGHRADIVICDDIVTLENSGPGVSDMQRQKIHDWFFQGVMAVPPPGGKVVVIGTAADLRDLHHELQKPQHGFKVIKLQAIIDDDEKEVLWPERYPYQWLDDQRESDFTAFMKRYQNEALDESTLRFTAENLERCKDYTRKWGEITQAMRDDNRTTVIVSLDPASGQSRRAKYCGICVLAFDPKKPEPRRYDVLEIWHDRMLFDDLVDEFIRLVNKYGARLGVIENNAAQQWLLQSRVLRAFRESGHRVEGFHTSGEKKVDPDTGLDSLAPITQARLITFPYGDERSRRAVDEFFVQEAIPSPQSKTTDRLMALWFAVHKARELGRSGWRVIPRKLPVWARARSVLARPDYGKTA